MIVSEMTAQECRSHLAESRVGRLGCVSDGVPYVVPVSFVYENGHIYSFSLIGHKVEAMRGHPQVCFEVDEIRSPRDWWSVVAFGRYEELPDAGPRQGERDKAWALLQKARSNWWDPGSETPRSEDKVARPPHLFFRINVEKITGRRGLV
ncbi:MAG: pyridoxamine 5'-phosphate oxidase family protein [Mesorhizobium sp.]|uniref:pyridoxamine 5'-phosphate oxidase family protein n=1 Tax=Mesorhizobium sp. TaxID=1871066 RepID=UPI000FE8E0C9|nr:pyridoxamine 5'-phosphate oxidase family protein [Mesorhizobium sp.]RWD60944.1 MAG: pyridoxamine 5'-phosphate oxidase family protein [Mesorhizobium sp.]RWE50709.1 MAG: pyridoxamine 5'-phosphate oxidase family protein [Mesorhizobium sp.]TIV72946.1 MAG: pyridoxamine 5'-phosphate oxidase family protein [Mesorhizobium sp.]TIV98642.1 MAG: pyridoxamine 5'-phosphate oxidase family protein [Mesorhizobium sp.]